VTNLSAILDCYHINVDDNHVYHILRQEIAFLYFDICSFEGVDRCTDFFLVIAKVRGRSSLKK
jgi:hypothetical protein